MSSQIVDTVTESASGWPEAIRFAEAELQRFIERTRQLRKAIRLMKQNQSDGVKWPKTAKYGRK